MRAVKVANIAWITYYFSVQINIRSCLSLPTGKSHVGTHHCSHTQPRLIIYLLFIYITYQDYKAD